MFTNFTGYFLITLKLWNLPADLALPNLCERQQAGC